MDRYQIISAADPKELDKLTWDEVHEGIPSSSSLGVDPTPYLKYLPSVEKEIFFLLFFKKKDQYDASKLLGVSQPTISYRYARSTEKLKYLVVLDPLDVEGTLEEIPGLREIEQKALSLLARLLHFSKVGIRFSLHQTRISFMLGRAKRIVTKLEREDPEKWSRHFTLVLLIDTYMGLRIVPSDEDSSY